MPAKFVFIVFILFACSAQKKSRVTVIPPGTVRVNDTLFIDSREVNNIGWRSYVSYLLRVKKDTQAYENALPDTLVWSTSEFYDPMSEYYYAHPRFNNYPAVGVSYEQAINFCSWRTYMVNQGIYFRKNKIKDPLSHLLDTFPQLYIYRLPSKEEWEAVAATGIDSSTRLFKKFNRRSSISYNTKEQVDAIWKKRDDNRPLTSDALVTTVESYYISKAGTYNMIGNVAEMISEKGIAKGGSFDHPLDSCRVAVDQHYSKPEKWLGFRCVAVLVK
jgi:formylglycine-generating enzyme required for sulfatase activity